MQAENPDSSEHPLRNKYIRSELTVEQGLPDNVVNAISQTENGLLWIGTGTGLASFDGVAFHQLRLKVEGSASTGAVNALLRASNGDLWVGTDAGATVLPRAAQDHIDPGTLKLLRTAEGISEDAQVIFETRNRDILVGGRHGLYLYSGKVLVPVLKNVYVNRISQAADGHLYIVTSDGLIEVAGKNRIPATVTAKQLGVPPDQVFEVHQGGDGTVWYGTHAGIRRQSHGLVSSLTPSHVGNTATNHIYEDPQGHIWAGTGIGLYLVSGARLENLDTLDLPRSIYVTESGDVWLGTNGNGLWHYKPRAIRVYTKKDGLPNDQPMALLARPNGQLLVGSNCGFSIFDGKRFRKYFEKDGLTNTCIWSLAQDSKENVWIGTYGGGLFKFTNGHFTQFSKADGLPDTVVTKIVVAQDDSLWIATPNGLSHMQGKQFHNYGRTEGLSSDHVLDVHEDGAHTIWVASRQGIDHLVGERFERLESALAANDGLPSRFVEDGSGNCYVAGTPYGLSKLENGQLTKIFDNLNVNGMIELPGHQLWCTSRHGIYRFPFESITKRLTIPDSPLDYRWVNASDGLLSSQTSVGSPNIVQTTDGKVWVATVKGLAQLDVNKWPQATQNPIVFIPGITIEGIEVPVGQSLTLSPGAHRTEITLAAVDLDAPDTIRMQYSLEGVDSGWQNTNASRAAVYTTIPPGTHRFLVRSTNSDGVWGKSDFAYDVKQQAFLYERLWFRLLLAGVALLAISVLYLVRVNVLVIQARLVLGERMQERERIARDLHDTFFQGIQGLLLRFNTGTTQLRQDEPARAIFEEALQQSDGVMLEGRELVLDLRSPTRDTTDLSEALAEVALSLRRLRHVTFRSICNGSIQALHPIIFEEAYRIGKEALTNGFRHAEASEMETEINFDRNEFRLRIRDNGIGLDRTILGNGFREGHWGLPGMRERAAKIGGRLDIWSRTGLGTEIELRIPASVAYRSRRQPVRSRVAAFLRLG